MPIQTMDFVPVPEPKTVKNRVHWDVTIPSAQSVAALVEAAGPCCASPAATSTGTS
jgi:hypothetical protein